MKRFLVISRTLLFSALVATTFSNCALLGAAILLVEKTVNAFVGNTVDSSPVRLNMSIPLRPGPTVAKEGAAVDQVPSAP